MSIANIFIMEAADLYCGDLDPTASNKLTLEEIKLPDFKQTSISSAPGGAVCAVDWATTMLHAPTASFKLKGMDPARLVMFGLGSQMRRKFTCYGAVRDKRSNKGLQGIAVIEGVLMEMNGSPFSRGAGMDHDYVIGEIVSYEYTLDNKPIHKLEFFTSLFEVGGISQSAEQNRLLGSV
jgi:uncharacterized protein